MPHRRWAGPQIPAISKDVVRALPALSEEQLRQLAAALEIEHIPPRTAENLRSAIRDVVIEYDAIARGTPARVVAANIERLVRDLKPVAKFYETVDPVTREVLGENDTISTWPLFRAIAEALKSLPERAKEILEEEHNHTRVATAVFFYEIDEAVTELADRRDMPDLRRLPGRDAHDRAERYPLFNTARTCVDIALALATAHAPGAVLALQRLQNLRDSTFLERLYPAHKARSLEEAIHLAFQQASHLRRASAAGASHKQTGK